MPITSMTAQNKVQTKSVGGAIQTASKDMATLNAGQKMRVAVLRKEIAQRGNSVEFPESVIIEGQYGDRAGTKHLVGENGVIYAHVYNAWMENTRADIEHTPLSDETYVMLTNRVKELKLK